MEKRVYDAQDIMKILGISKSTCYRFLEKTHKEKAPFRVIKIGSCVRVPKEEFDRWLMGII